VTAARRAGRCTLVAAALLAACGGLRRDGETPPRLTHGVAVGEVSDTGAVVWGRCDRAGTLQVRLGDARPSAVDVDARRDFTGRIALTGLTPNTPYSYRAWCGDNERDGRDGRFATAPAPDAARPLRIVWSGDLGGQNVCRDAVRGYPIFPVMAARQPDLFIALGDMIYGDDVCSGTGRYGNAQIAGPPAARSRPGYWAHWRYNRADPGHQALLASTAMAAVWDDHEIVNDAGPAHDSPPLQPAVHLLGPALEAFLDYQPLLPPAGEPTRMYRSQRWGKHVEIFFLDTRQYRDANSAADDPAAPKSMLGPQQRRWLEEALAASTATWKIIVASVPLAVPTGDGFASGDSDRGFEHEAAELFAVLHARGVHNPLWLTTDVHIATGMLYRPIADDPQWESRELITGPLNAGIFPQRGLDPTFRPQRLFFYGPKSADSVTSFGDAVHWFNFGMLEVLASGRLSASIVNGNGQTVYRMTLKPQP
jgi:alkaline phosphatase D